MTEVGFIYKITNLINGCVYIGATMKSINRRWSEHKCNSIKQYKNSLINIAIREFGIENFKIEKIKTCYRLDQYYFSEQYFIEKYKSRLPEFGYNNSQGGKISSKGKRVSSNTKIKISIAQRGKKRKPHSEQTKQKMRLKAIGRDTSKAVANSVRTRKGKPLSKERRRQISEQNQGINSKPVLQFDKLGNLIGEFNSITEAAKCVGAHQGSISNNLLGNSQSCSGFIWKYKK